MALDQTSAATLRAGMQEHVGHDIVCVNYYDGVTLASVALECETCGCVLLCPDEDEWEDDV